MREHWRTWAMAAILVLSGIARCSVPRAVVTPAVQAAAVSAAALLSQETSDEKPH